jgi:DNA-directed RNA polymerase
VPRSAAFHRETAGCLPTTLEFSCRPSRNTSHPPKSSQKTRYATSRNPLHGAAILAVPRLNSLCSLIKSCKDPEKCARYLAKALEECIPDVAVEASKVMNWLRAIARTLAKAGVGMAWTSPAGFPVVHEVREPKEVRLATADSTIIIYEDDPARKIDWRKQVDGIVAHLVHSLDAAHMMLTVNRLHLLGLRHFAMVHDSFGVHASDVDLLNRTVREEFVTMHSEPLMANSFKEQLLATGIALPSLPPPGTLDIREVVESPYFFA